MGSNPVRVEKIESLTGGSGPIYLGRGWNGDHRYHFFTAQFLGYAELWPPQGSKKSYREVHSKGRPGGQYRLENRKWRLDPSNVVLWGLYRKKPVRGQTVQNTSRSIGSKVRVCMEKGPFWNFKSLLQPLNERFTEKRSTKPWEVTKLSAQPHYYLQG